MIFFFGYKKKITLNVECWILKRLKARTHLKKCTITNSVLHNNNIVPLLSIIIIIILRWQYDAWLYFMTDSPACKLSLAGQQSSEEMQSMSDFKILQRNSNDKWWKLNKNLSEEQHKL